MVSIHDICRCCFQLQLNQLPAEISGGSFLFAGPTGVGKTELAKALAAELFDNEHRCLAVEVAEGERWYGYGYGLTKG